MAEKPSKPVWSIFTFKNEGARLQDYDIFPKLDTPDVEKGVIPSPSTRGGDPLLVKSEDCTSPRATGRFKVKEENVNSGFREKAQLSGSEEVDTTASQSLLREFRLSTLTSTEPGEAVAAALKYFETKRLESGRKSNFPILDYQRTLKNYYPEFFDKGESGIVGHVPGVEVGLRVRYRDELRLLGIHREKQKGIDSKDKLCKDGYNHERVALSVVLSGVYEDCKDHGKVLIYVGEGGRDVKLNQQVKDQTKKRLGNQALRNNCHYHIPVRVIRKQIDANSPSKRLFSYDGLYKVEDWEYITGMAGFKVYRFKLVREPDQNALVWQKREPKPFEGRATHQDATDQRETKPFKGCATRQDATEHRETKPFVGRVGRAARRKATVGRAMEPSVGQVVRQEATAGGKQVSTSEYELDFIDVSDEESVSSESGESEENSVIELSDDESMSSEENEENSISSEESVMLEGELPVDMERVIGTICDEGKTIPQDTEEEALNDGVDKSTLQPSRLRSGSGNCTSTDEKMKVSREEEKITEDSSDGESLAEGHYEVEKIVDKRVKSRQVQYLVRWLGYVEEEDSWLPLDRLSHCRKLLDEFNSSRKKRKIG